MAKCDVAIIGAGSAGLVASALLAKHGKKVTVIEGDRYLCGRAKAVPFDEGYGLTLGGHLLEDEGTGITRIMEYLGKELKHGPVSKGMPVYDEGKWKSVKDLYSSNKNELKIFSTGHGSHTHNTASIGRLSICTTACRLLSSIKI